MPPKKKGAAPGRVPVLLTIQQVVSPKKLKEVAACELNLADFATRQAQPYAVRIKVEWRIKIPKQHEAQLAERAGDIILRIEPSEVAPPQPSPRTSVAAPSSASAQPPALNAPPPVASTAAAAAVTASTNPFGPAPIAMTR